MRYTYDLASVHTQTNDGCRNETFSTKALTQRANESLVHLYTSSGFAAKAAHTASAIAKQFLI